MPGIACLLQWCLQPTRQPLSASCNRVILCAITSFVLAQLCASTSIVCNCFMHASIVPCRSQMRHPKTFLPRGSDRSNPRFIGYLTIIIGLCLLQQVLTSARSRMGPSWSERSEVLCKGREMQSSLQVLGTRKGPSVFCPSFCMRYSSINSSVYSRNVQAAQGVRALGLQTSSLTSCDRAASMSRLSRSSTFGSNSARSNGWNSWNCISTTSLWAFKSANCEVRQSYCFIPDRVICYIMPNSPAFIHCSSFLLATYFL